MGSCISSTTTTTTTTITVAKQQPPVQPPQQQQQPKTTPTHFEKTASRAPSKKGSMKRSLSSSRKALECYLTTRREETTNDALPETLSRVSSNISPSIASRSLNTFNSTVGSDLSRKGSSQSKLIDLDSKREESLKKRRKSALNIDSTTTTPNPLIGTNNNNNNNTMIRVESVENHLLCEELVESPEDENEDCYIFADSFWLTREIDPAGDLRIGRSKSIDETLSKIIPAFSLKHPYMDREEEIAYGVEEMASEMSKTFSFNSSNNETCYTAGGIGAFSTEDELRRHEMDEIINLRTTLANEELEQLKLYEFPAW